MAVDAYIQSALTQLHSALDHLQQHMNELRHHSDQEKHQLQQDIQHLEDSVRAEEAAMLQQKTDMEKQVFYDRIRHHHHEADTKKVRLSQIDGELQHTMQTKAQIYKDMQNVTYELNRILALPDVH